MFQVKNHRVRRDFIGMFQRMTGPGSENMCVRLLVGRMWIFGYLRYRLRLCWSLDDASASSYSMRKKAGFVSWLQTFMELHRQQRRSGFRVGMNEAEVNDF